MNTMLNLRIERQDLFSGRLAGFQVILRFEGWKEWQLHEFHAGLHLRAAGQRSLRPISVRRPVKGYASPANPAAAPMSYSERTNLVGPRVVLEQAGESGTSTFIFGGSLQVYGRKVSGIVDESQPYGPILDISHLSKLYVEKLMEMFAINRGLRCVSARLALVYGVSPITKTDPLFMTAPNKFCWLVARGEPMRVDPSAFNPTSMIHVDDAARGLMSLAGWKRPAYSAVNLLGETASVAQVARLVQEIASTRGMVVRLDYPQGVPTTQIECDFRSSMAEVGYQPQRSLKRDLPEVLDHFLTLQRGSGVSSSVESTDSHKRGGRGHGEEGGAQDPALRGAMGDPSTRLPSLGTQNQEPSTQHPPEVEA